MDPHSLETILRNYLDGLNLRTPWTDDDLQMLLVLASAVGTAFPTYNDRVRNLLLLTHAELVDDNAQAIFTLALDHHHSPIDNSNSGRTIATGATGATGSTITTNEDSPDSGVFQIEGHPGVANQDNDGGGLLLDGQPDLLMPQENRHDGAQPEEAPDNDDLTTLAGADLADSLVYSTSTTLSSRETHRSSW